MEVFNSDENSIRSTQLKMASIPKLLPIFLSLIFLNHGVYGFFGIFPNVRFSASFNLQLSQDAQANQTINQLITNAQQMGLNVDAERNNIENEMYEIIDSIRQISENNLTNLISATNANISNFLNNGANLETIRNCTQDQTSNIEQLANDTMINIEQCFIDKFEEGLAIVNKCMQNHEAADNIAEDLVQGYADCLRLGYGNIFFVVSPNVLACKYRLISSNSIRIAALESEIVKNIIDGSTFLATLKEELAACAFLHLIEATAAAGQIASEIALCISQN